jgi:ParB family chromosome partitioning protein
MSQVTFKSLIKDGTAKRADAMKFRIEDIHEEPGFNLRREGEDLDASIDALAAHIAQGGMVPPLEVRPREAGGVFVVDGHRRRRAFLKVADSIRDGNGELWLPVVAFTGNDADRIARIMTSAEGRSLAPLEVAEGYKRLVALNWTAEQIAQRVGKTRQHVDQLLILANANADVHALVADGKIAASTAIDAARKHGENAGAVLREAVDKAADQGKGKAKAGDVKGKALPRKVVDQVVEVIGYVEQSIPARTLAQIAAPTTEADSLVEVPVYLLREVLRSNALIRDTQAKQASRGQAAAVKAAQGELAEGARA